MIEGIVLDLDDTLYPSREYLESGFCAVSRYLGQKYGIDPEEALGFMRLLYHRYHEREVLTKTVCYFDLDAGVIVELVSVFRVHKPTLSLYPGYRNVLQRLSERWVLGLLVDGDPEVQERKLEVLRINHFFRSIFFIGKHPESKMKPHSFAYQMMARVMRCSPTTLVYVADNPLIDFVGARKAGYQTIRVRAGDYMFGEFPVDLEAQACIDSLSQLESYLDAHKF